MTSFGSLRSFRAGRDGDGTCTFEYDANEDAAAAAPGLHGLKVAGAVLAAALGEHAAATLAPLLAPPTPVLRVQGVVSLAALNKARVCVAPGVGVCEGVRLGVGVWCSPSPVYAARTCAQC